MENLFKTGRDVADVREKLMDKLSARYGGTCESRVNLMLSLGGKALAAYVKKDLGKRYSLLEDWLLPPVAMDLPEYDDGWISIMPMGDGTTLILVYAYTSDKDHDYCDGASLFPDNVKGVLPGAIFHDIWYERMEAIVDAWGWSVSKVRKIGDQIFASIMMEEGANKAVVNLCYWPIRWFGGVFHEIMKIKLIKKLIVIAAVLFALSAGGCVHSVFAPGGDIPYTPPVYVPAD